MIGRFKCVDPPIIPKLRATVEIGSIRRRGEVFDLRSWRDPATRRPRIGAVLAAVAVSVAFAGCGSPGKGPVLWIVFLSFKTPGSATDGAFIPHHWTLSNYSDIFKTGIFTSALRNSIGIALISTTLAVITALAAAYAIARLEFPGKRVILAVVLGVACSPGLIIPYMTFALPLSIFVLWSSFREIPWELEQAAEVDGATPLQAFTRVIAPLAEPGIVTTLIVVFIICWNDFVFATSLTSTTAAETVPAAISTFPGVSQFTVPYGDIAAAAVIVTVPLVLLVLLFQRRIVAGLTAGAVKG